MGGCLLTGITREQDRVILSSFTALMFGVEYSREFHHILVEHYNEASEKRHTICPPFLFLPRK